MEFEKIDSLNQVADFHRTFKHPILPDPSIPSADRCRLRVELISEELKELEEAIQQKDLVEIADALCDIQYVLSGAVLEFGLAGKFMVDDICGQSTSNGLQLSLRPFSIC